jgi:predicted transposase YbfD/YdcC
VKDSFILADNGAQALVVNQANDEINADHGRIEQRTIEVIDATRLKGFIDSRWRNLNSLVRVTSRREESNTIESEQRYYISSLPSKDPWKILRSIRQHWQIENCLHWSLDVSFNEDGCRVRNENAALNLSWMRKFALGLLKKDKSFKASIRRKQRKAAASTDYLARVITEN